MRYCRPAPVLDSCQELERRSQPPCNRSVEEEQHLNQDGDGEAARKSLILLVGPPGIEPRTVGL